MGSWMLRFAARQWLQRLRFVVHTDAIIFDLRENRGGQPAMVTLIASYLFDQRTHLIDIYKPQGGLYDAELDAVVSARGKADEAVGVCADLEADVLWRRGVPV
jgi:hypothetical protein